MKATTFTAYLLQPHTGAHAPLSNQTVGDLKLFSHTQEQVVLLETLELA